MAKQAAWPSLVLCLAFLGESVVTYESIHPNMAHMFKYGDERIMMKLLEKISDLERRVDKLERNELQMKDSIRVLIVANAGFRVENSKLEKRMSGIEAESKAKGQVIDDLVKRLEKLKADNNEFCVKEELLTCDKEEKTIKDDTRDKKTILQGQILPGFTAYLDYPIKDLGQDETIVYNQVLLNDGDAYNSSSGIFTATITGVYLFTWSTNARKLSGKSVYNIRSQLVVNGKHQLSAVVESRTDVDDNQGSNTAILRINKGDQIWTTLDSRSSSIRGNNVQRATSFSGALLHEV